jgi:hypothetical protein
MNLKKNKKNFILLLITLLLLCIVIEGGSYLVLRYTSKLQLTYPFFNQQISPYYVFGNAPGFAYKNSIKSNPDEKDAHIDSNGFITGSPLVKFKDTNTIRIFITGGSAAFGTGQIRPYYGEIKQYPTGLYSFESSIAGLLQKQLKLALPNKKIEVINACAVKRMLHQSVAYYLETISDFDPDIVVSLDGNNDVGSMSGIPPYVKGSMALSAYIDLYEITKLNRNKSFSNLINLLNTLKIANLQQKEKGNKKDFFADPYDQATYNDYLQHKEEYIHGSKKFLNMIQYYHAICATDDVDFIFCLQPLLYRQKINKTLSPSEKKMQSQFYTPNSKSHNAKEMFTPQQLESIKNSSNLILKYFIDDYLNEQIRQISVSEGFSYLDMNQEMMNMGADKDVFVDYCHLTPEGNNIVAGILSEKITEILLSSPPKGSITNPVLQK